MLPAWEILCTTSIKLPAQTAKFQQPYSILHLRNSHGRNGSCGYESKQAEGLICKIMREFERKDGIYIHEGDIPILVVNEQVN